MGSCRSKNQVIRETPQEPDVYSTWLAKEDSIDRTIVNLADETDWDSDEGCERFRSLLAVYNRNEYSLCCSSPIGFLILLKFLNQSILQNQLHSASLERILQTFNLRDLVINTQVTACLYPRHIRNGVTGKVTTVYEFSSIRGTHIKNQLFMDMLHLLPTHPLKTRFISSLTNHIGLHYNTNYIV